MEMEIPATISPQNELKVISGAVVLVSTLCESQPDGWLIEPWHVRVQATEGIGKVTISGRFPNGVGDRCPLIVTINEDPYTNYFDDGALVSWDISLAVSSDSIIDMMIFPPRFVVPARHGSADIRRLRFYLTQVVFHADVWSKIIAGPVTRTHNASGLWEDGWCGSIELEVEPRRPIDGISIGGRVGSQCIEPLQLRANVLSEGQAGQTHEEHHTLAIKPGCQTFRWMFPVDAANAKLIRLIIEVEEPTVISSSDGRRASYLLQDITFLPHIDLSLNNGGLVLSTVLLSYQRPDLLRITLGSYLDTISVPFELIVVDNASDEETRAVIAEFVERSPAIRSVLLDENRGGESLNIGIQDARGTFIHISENDLEYLAGWDRILLTKLMLFPMVGQLCVAASGPNPSSRWSVAGFSIDLALYNVTTPSVSPRELYFEHNLRWGTRGIPPVLFPDDGGFSDRVKEQGLYVAWNDHDLVINHGFDPHEFVRRLDYYVANYLAKPEAEGGLTGVDRRLRSVGYRLGRDAQGRWFARSLEENDGMDATQIVLPSTETGEHFV